MTTSRRNMQTEFGTDYGHGRISSIRPVRFTRTRPTWICSKV